MSGGYEQYWQNLLDNLKTRGPFEIGKKYTNVKNTCIAFVYVVGVTDIAETLNVTPEQAGVLEKVCVWENGLLCLPPGIEFEVLRQTVQNYEEDMVLMRIVIDNVPIELSMMLDDPLYEEFGIKMGEAE